MITSIGTGLYEFYDSRFRANFPGFIYTYQFYILAVIIAAFLDFLSTWQFMSAGSIADEVHPVIRGISHIFGPFWGPLIGKTGQILCLLWFVIIFKPVARITFIPVTLAYLYAAWFNTWGIELYTPMFFRLLV